MRKKLLLITITVVFVASGTAYYLRNSNISVLNPAGTIADQQRDLLILATVLSMIVVLPVFAMAGYIAWRYNEKNSRKAKYRPEWDGHRGLEALWWGIPLILITILSIVTWRSSYALDPFRPIEGANKAMTIQVVALDWKWLFIYPDEHIASVNYFQMPVDTPVKFEITADAPMNSFWLPNLGGQVYAMTGMATHLNLMADKPGDYKGVSANISGKGFADMVFTARASSDFDYRNWVQEVRGKPRKLNQTEYDKLVRPSVPEAPVFYSSVEHNLHAKIIDKYMKPQAQDRGNNEGHHSH